MYNRKMYINDCVSRRNISLKDTGTLNDASRNAIAACNFTPSHLYVAFRTDCIDF